MRTLSVVTVEDGGLVVVSDTGERFRLPIDDALRALVRSEPVVETRRPSPRDIQAQVRAGLSAQQVAAVTGASLAYVERFVGPVLAERRWVVDSALATRLPPAEDGAAPRTFGAVMGDRLAALAADGVRWSSAKEAGGWIVAVAFTADAIEHDARWRFDPKRQQLAPENVEAATLSQEGVPAALTPRLRAIEPTGPVRVPQPAPEPAPSRFDSQAFALPPDLDPGAEPAPVRSAPTRTAPRRTGAERTVPDRTPAERTVPEQTAPERTADRATPAAPEPARPEPAPAAAALPPTQAMPTVRAAHRAPVASTTAPVAPAVPPAFAKPPASRPTVAAPTAPVPPAVVPLRPAASSAPVTRLPERTAPAAPEDDEPQRAPVRPAAGRRGRPRDQRRPVRTDDAAPTRPVSLPGRGRGGRTSMPSWDEIVFGRDED